MSLIQKLIEQFPIPADFRPNPGCMNNKLTGNIPIEFFLQHESDITAARKEFGAKIRVVYRGTSNHSLVTGHLSAQCQQRGPLQKEMKWT